MSFFFKIIILLLLFLQITSSTDNKNIVKYFSIIEVEFDVIHNKNSTYILRSQGDNSHYLFYCKKCDFSVGDVIYFNARILPLKHKLTPKSFDNSYYIGKYNLKGTLISKSRILTISKKQKNILIEARDRLINLIDSNSKIGLSLALLTGNKSQISKEVYDNFRITGVAHILAISGLHIGGIAFIFFYLVRLLLSCSRLFSIKYNNKKIALCFSYLAALFFLFVADFPISGQRALIFLGFIYIALLFDSKIAPINLILMSVIILLCDNPSNLFHPSFQMSLAAMVAICRFVSDRKAVIHTGSVIERIYRYEKDILIVSLYISVVIIPFTIFHFGNSSLISPITNLVIIPLVTLIIMPFGMLTLVSGLINLESLFFCFFDRLLVFLVNIVNIFAKFAVTTPTFIELNNYSLMLILLSLVIFLISSGKELDILATILFLLAFCVGVFDFKPDLSLSTQNKIFIAKESKNNFVIPNKKISSYNKEQLQRYYKNFSLINYSGYSGKNLFCREKLCVYKKDDYLISIIYKKTSFDRFQRVCDLSDLVVNFSNDRNNCYKNFNLNNYDLMKFGTLHLFVNGKIKIKNI